MDDRIEMKTFTRYSVSPQNAFNLTNHSQYTHIYSIQSISLDNIMNSYYLTGKVYIYSMR